MLLDRLMARLQLSDFQLRDLLLCFCRYKAALQSEQARSRSLAVALHAKQRLQGQQHCSPLSPQPQQAQHADGLLKSAMKMQHQQHQQVSSGHVSTGFIKSRPMTACSVLQTKLGAPPSILQRPASARARLAIKLK